jgi:hypothetical protein
VGHHIETSTDADAVNGGDDWYVEALEGDIGLGLVTEKEAGPFKVRGRFCGGVLEVVRTATAEVSAGTEPPAGASDDEAADGTIGSRLLKHVPELIEQGHAEGVEFLGAVQCDPEDAVRRPTALSKHGFE